jgi:hypothetical protein
MLISKISISPPSREFKNAKKNHSYRKKFGSIPFFLGNILLFNILKFTKNWQTKYFFLNPLVSRVCQSIFLGLFVSVLCSELVQNNRCCLSLGRGLAWEPTSNYSITRNISAIVIHNYFFTDPLVKAGREVWLTLS